MCDCFHLAFPNWHAASETGGGRRLRGPEPGTEDDSVCDEPSTFTEEERPRPQGSSPVEEFPDAEKYTDLDKELEAEHDPHCKSGSGKKTKKSGLGSMFEKRSTPKMSKLKEVHTPESEVIVKTTKDGSGEGLVYGGGGKEGIFIKGVVPESPASKSLGLKEGDQVLSATVYFDNMSYEDAIQILDHAQAYKVKLCLKRKPDITETEPVMESDIIPEEELDAPEMREQGKTKRRGDARISWPKFPSFGKGRKSRFTRSHSSSEADEQRKLELSPTTSDTESPIKTQEALKGKKRHKIKLSALTKSGRMSPSEEQCLESPSGETPEDYTLEELKVVEDLSLDQNLTKPQIVELININSSVKTTDLTVALAEKQSQSAVKSPDGKKKKKEKSEFKIKILGKDKLHKKETKARSSPKRLKTLGASIEIADQPETEKSDFIPSSESQSKLQGDPLKIDPNIEIISSEKSKVISEISMPKVELDVDVPFLSRSPRKSEEKMKKFDVKQEDMKTGPSIKLPKIGFSDIAVDETIQKMNANADIQIEQHTTQGPDRKDPYEQLSSRTQLPKREEIEIPGMEDISLRTTAKGRKDPKARSMGRCEEPQAETVQLLIDVDSVKEAVSKLPGYKLPKVDTEGVPIPEEITVIDANAQRISVKTPTKVVDSKIKCETHFTKFDITASPDSSKTAMKLPKIAPGDSTSQELFETEVDLKTNMKHKPKMKQSDVQIKTEVCKREDIVIPGKESAEDGIILQMKVTDKTVSPKESERKSRKAKITSSGFGIAKPNIKIPDIGIDLPKQNISRQKDGTLKEETIVIQEVKTGTGKDEGQIGGAISDVKIPGIDGIEYIDSTGGSPAKTDGGIPFTGFGVSLDVTKPNTDVYIPGVKIEEKDIDGQEYTMKLPKREALTAGITATVDTDEHLDIDRKEVKKNVKEGKGSKFKMPHIGISMPKVKGPKIDLSSSKRDVDVERPELEIKSLQPEGEFGKLEIAVPDVRGPEAELSFSQKDSDVPKLRSQTKIPDDPKIHVDFKQQEHQAYIDVHRSGKFKIPKFGILLPKRLG
ncbi:protein AHNAK2-like [Antennarius striatus]|uniref:protein AHNAK2-like n=1 Tax=Antennarius striatus TaxID=241820 RepID=UPI0035B2E575